MSALLAVIGGADSRQLRKGRRASCGTRGMFGCVGGETTLHFDERKERAGDHATVYLVHYPGSPRGMVVVGRMEERVFVSRR